MLLSMAFEKAEILLNVLDQNFMFGARLKVVLAQSGP